MAQADRYNRLVSKLTGYRDALKSSGAVGAGAGAVAGSEAGEAGGALVGPGGAVVGGVAGAVVGGVIGAAIQKLGATRSAALAEQIQSYLDDLARKWAAASSDDDRNAVLAEATLDVQTTEETLGVPVTVFTGDTVTAFADNVTKARFDRAIQLLEALLDAIRSGKIVVRPGFKIAISAVIRALIAIMKSLQDDWDRNLQEWTANAVGFTGETAPALADEAEGDFNTFADMLMPAPAGSSSPLNSPWLWLLGAYALSSGGVGLRF